MYYNSMPSDLDQMLHVLDYVIYAFCVFQAFKITRHYSLKGSIERILYFIIFSVGSSGLKYYLVVSVFSDIEPKIISNFDFSYTPMIGTLFLGFLTLILYYREILIKTIKLLFSHALKFLTSLYRSTVNNKRIVIVSIFSLAIVGVITQFARIKLNDIKHQKELEVEFQSLHSKFAELKLKLKEYENKTVHCPNDYACRLNFINSVLNYSERVNFRKCESTEIDFSLKLKTLDELEKLFAVKVSLDKKFISDLKSLLLNNKYEIILKLIDCEKNIQFTTDLDCKGYLLNNSFLSSCDYSDKKIGFESPYGKAIHEEINKISNKMGGQRPNEFAPVLKQVDCPKNDENKMCIYVYNSKEILLNKLSCVGNEEDNDTCNWFYFSDGSFLIENCHTHDSVSHSCFLRMFKNDGKEDERFSSLFQKDYLDQSKGRIGSIHSIHILPTDTIEIRGYFQLYEIDKIDSKTRYNCDGEDCVGFDGISTKAIIELDKTGKLIKSEIIK